MRSAGEGWAISTSLPAGAYLVTSYVRPCDANCGNLDPPSETCSSTISVEGGSRVALDVVLHTSQGCTITKR
jgi:hypothetical protein